jgi:hypothetical protein
VVKDIPPRRNRGNVSIIGISPAQVLYST